MTSPLSKKKSLIEQIRVLNRKRQAVKTTNGRKVKGLDSAIVKLNEQLFHILRNQS